MNMDITVFGVTSVEVNCKRGKSCPNITWWQIVITGQNHDTTEIVLHTPADADLPPIVPGTGAEGEIRPIKIEKGV